MKLTNLPEQFKLALPIIETIRAAGYEAYFVGGSVRDTILEKPIHDVDIASSAYPAEVKEIFNRTVDTGIEHGTVMVLDHGTGYEVTTFRTESGYQDYRRPDKVVFVRSLKDDLKRRDFTINALAMDDHGDITDLFGGLTDLTNKVIKAVGDPNERFHEDALRMMRAVRFSSQLNFSIETNTKLAIKDHAQLLEKIALERIHEEFIKLMLGQAAANGLAQLIETNLFQYLPGLSDSATVLSQLSQNNIALNNEAQVWSLLAITIGINDQQVAKWLRRWKTSNKIINDVEVTVKLLNKIQSATVWDIYQAGTIGVENAIAVANITQPKRDFEQLRQQLHQLPITNKKDLVVTGKDLMEQKVVTPGPQLGNLLTFLEQQVVNGQIPNQQEALINASKEYMEINN